MFAFCRLDIETDNIAMLGKQALCYCLTDEAKTNNSDFRRYSIAHLFYLSIASITMTQARQIPNVITKPIQD